MEYLLSALEMGELDRQTSQDYAISGRMLMELAGRGAADVCLSLLAPNSRVAIACGGGNNGGDGFVVARMLASRGHYVQAFVFTERSRVRGDADLAFKAMSKNEEAQIIWIKDARGLVEFSSAIGSAALVVDALLGTGLRDDVRGLLGDAISVINDHQTPVVSIDIPSGVHSDTGEIMGRAVTAKHTVTFAHPKRGHYLYPGADLRGDLTVIDIGIPNVLTKRQNIVGRVVHPADGPALLRARGCDSHKGSFGHVVVVAGSALTPGAANLTLRGALRAGAGLVSWGADEATLAHSNGRPDEVMLRTFANGTTETVDKLLSNATALVIGPGLSTAPERKALLRALLERAQVPVCLDADALNILATNPDLWELVRPDTVLTPHPKEMSRLANTSVADIQRDRFAAALQLAIGRKCVVVLKGAGTVVADAEGTVSVVAAGNPGLATGGTGDVLAGVIGSLLAQRLDACVAAQAGVLLHGMAGDIAAARHGQSGMCASDVIEAMGSVLAHWQR